MKKVRLANSVNRREKKSSSASVFMSATSSSSHDSWKLPLYEKPTHGGDST